MLMMLIYWAEAHILLRKTQTLVVASKWIGLAVNADTTKFMVTSQDENAG